MQNAPPDRPAFDWSKMPANPGSTFRIHVRPHPETGEIIRGWNRQNNGIMYRDTAGRLSTYHGIEPNPANETKAATFLASARVSGPLRLVPRAERRALWRDERKRYRAIVKARKSSGEVA